MTTSDVLEIFNSISGEVSPFHQGCPATFLRLAKCNLKCEYCDTPNAHDDGENWKDKKLITDLTELYQKTGRLCITGGEPLLQKSTVHFLLNYFKNVWIETNGSIDFSEFIGVAGIVADFKLGTAVGIPHYFYNLKKTDFIKFVIGNMQSFFSAINIQRILQNGRCEACFAYSPMFGRTEVKWLLEQLSKYMLPNTIINIQIHKYLDMK